MKCKNCIHYELYQMLINGSWGYTGGIPCLRCKHFNNNNDEFVRREKKVKEEK